MDAITSEYVAPPDYTVENGPRDSEPVINASGHVQELERNFNFLSACSVGICVGNTWAAFGGSIVVSMYNGGPPGVIYELLAVSVFYWIMAACIAELASAIPSSAGVYHWASVTGGKYGKPIGYFAGWWNFFAWVFGAASGSSILANQIISMWALFHPDYTFERWHSFVIYLLVTWMTCTCVLFGNRFLPVVNQLGLVFTLGGVIVTIIACAILPSTKGNGHASTEFVWREWDNLTGYKSDGFVFLMGMLNGAYSVGTPDCVSHLAEEIPNPRVNIPKAIAAQMVVGLITAFFYLIALFYSISDLDSVFENPYTFPLAELYRQASSSSGGALGLLIVIFCPTLCSCIGCYITTGRMLWTLARDKATPFADVIGRISPTWKNPFNATFVCGCICTVLGCIYVGSLTAFNAFVGSFVILSTLSYLAAILPHALSRRRNLAAGPFWMHDWVAYAAYAISSMYIVVFVVIFCFPYSLPVSAATMNYSSLITGGLTLFVGMWWLWIGKSGYVGPQLLLEEQRRIASENRQRVRAAKA